MSQVLLYRLKKNRAAILQDLEPDQVIDYLYQEDVLDSDTYEDVRNERSRKKQATLLLSYIERDSCAIQKMVDGLQKSSQRHLACILNQSLPDEVSRSEGVLKQYERDSPNYPMSHVPCGYAVIINNTFKTSTKVEGSEPAIWLTHRDGSQTDVLRMTELFEWLQFKVVNFQDKTKNEIITIVRRYTVDDDHADFDCFVLFLMSHGFEHGIYGSDGRKLHLQKDIRKFLTADMSVGLANKPKLIFVQACRGQKADKGVEVTDSPSLVAQPTPTQENNSITTYTPSNLDSVPTFNMQVDVEFIPQDSDIMITYASTASYAAMRHTARGGWFVTHLYDVMRQYARTEDLQGMITKVAGEVSKHRCENNRRDMQCPESNGNLRKKLFFKPKSS